MELSREDMVSCKLYLKDDLALVGGTMHDKAPLNVVLASMRECPAFKAACDAVAASALPGVRTPFSRESVQSSLRSNTVRVGFELLE